MKKKPESMPVFHLNLFKGMENKQQIDQENQEKITDNSTLNTVSKRGLAPAIMHYSYYQLLK